MARGLKTKPGKGRDGKKERFEVLLEDINGKFDFIAESTSNLLKLPPLMGKMANDLEVVRTDVGFMKGLLQA